MYACCVVLLLLAIGQGTIGIPLADFYPFGSEAGDSSLPSNDDGSSGSITLSFTFPFFGTDYRMAYVNNNGVLSFERSVRQFTSDPFPLVNNPDLMLIAPYWADVDTRGTGRVWYRQSSDEALLLRARREIRSAFVSQMTFQPTMLFVATWDHVGHYNRQTARTNTFQCVMITDGRRSFVIFLYADGEIQWTTGDASGGRNGFGGTEAQVGFNAGDGIRFASVPGSRTGDIVNIDTTSNVGIPGVWVFRVDEDDITVMRNCSDDPAVPAVIGPRFGSQLGGTAVHITGPCFNETDQIACIFDNQPEQAGFYVNNLTVICVSPNFNTVGWKDLTVMVTRDGNLAYVTRSRFYATHSGESTDITVDQDTILLMAGNRITMRWDPESLLPLVLASSFTVDINLLQYNNEAQTWIPFLSIAQGQPNTGVAEFTVPFSNEVQRDISPVTLQLSISRALRPSRRQTTSLVRTAGSLVRRAVHLYYGGSISLRLLCAAWYFTESSDMGERLLSQVPNCCATEAGADLPNSDFVRDNRLISFFHPEADTCFRQKPTTITSGSPGQQCCYKDGELLMGPDSGGTVDRYAPDSDFLLHQVHDVLPYLYCCTGAFSSATCGLYYERRPSSRGESCSRPPPACVYGDPHIVTLDGFKYTFNGLGEFVLIETDSNRFSLQGRMVQAVDDVESPISATVFSAIAGKELYSDTVQFELADDDDEVNVLINGELIDFDGLPEQQFNNVSVRGGGGSSATAVFSSGVYVEVRAANGILSTLLVSLADSYRSRTSGLMGNYNRDVSDDLLPRGASSPIPLTSSLIDIHNLFGVTWIIDSPTDSLFTYASGQSWSTFYQPDFRPAFDPIFTSTDLEMQADDICGDDRFCRFDIAATSRIDIGLTTLLGSLEFEAIANISQPVICSPPCEFGICVSNDTCSCADGYTGATCADRMVRDCGDINPCENGGACSLVATSYVCSCPEGTSGLFCEQIEAGSASGLLPMCTCARDVECSLIGQVKNSRLTPSINQLKCTIQAESDPIFREKLVIDSTFNSRYLSPGSLTFLASIGALPRDVGFMSCVINGSAVQPFLDVLGARSISITYTKSDGSFGALDLSMDSLQDIMSGGDDFTLGEMLDEVNLCSLQNLLLWMSAPQPAQVSTCRDPVNDSGTTVAYFPVRCPQLA